MNNFEQYQPTLDYPSKAYFTTTYYYSNGRVVASLGPDGKTNFTDPQDAGLPTQLANTVLAKCVTESVLDRAAYKEALVQYQAQLALLENKFRTDLFCELGITDNPKREKLYSIAYDKGHAHGYAEVYAVACSLVELIED